MGSSQTQWNIWKVIYFLTTFITVNFTELINNEIFNLINNEIAWQDLRRGIFDAEMLYVGHILPI